MIQKDSETSVMPVLFIGHGNPMNAIEENEFVEGWRAIEKTIPKPVAILCVSAHWETKGTMVTAMHTPKTIHDFGGFPQALFNVAYPAPGSLELAQEIKNNITVASIELDYEWGLDHGCWSVLSRMYPTADIPVVQLSLDYTQSPQLHFEIAKELANLRRKGVLILGSGNMVHNLHLVAWDKLSAEEYGYDWAMEANELMKKYIVQDDFKQLINYKSLGMAVNMAIPTPEHFLPLLYILALKEPNERMVFFNDKAIAGSLTMTCVKIG